MFTLHVQLFTWQFFSRCFPPFPISQHRTMTSELFAQTSASLTKLKYFSTIFFSVCLISDPDSLTFFLKHILFPFFFFFEFETYFETQLMFNLDSEQHYNFVKVLLPFILSTVYETLQCLNSHCNHESVFSMPWTRSQGS